MKTQNYTNEDLAGLIIEVRQDVKNLDGKVGSLEKRIDVLDTKLDGAVEFLVEKIEDNTQALDRLTDRVRGVENRMDDFSMNYLKIDSAEGYMISKGFVKK